MKAIIQGEVHISKRDRENLLGRLSEHTDFVFLEGSKNPDWGKASLGFKFFLVGFWLYAKPLRKFREVWGPLVKEVIQSGGFDYDDEIDLSLDTIYEKFSFWTKLLTAILSHMIWTVFGLLILRANMPDLLSSFTGRILTAAVVYPFVGPLGYALILFIHETDEIGVRDEVMSDNIIEKSEQIHADEVVISCGQRHVYKIKENLEGRGWEVELYNSFWAWLSITYWKRKLWD